MVTMPRRGDLDLNHAPAPAPTAAALWESVKDGLRQTMLQHEVIFKNQVRELHRLYWTQMNLMSEMRWKHSASISGAKSRCGSADVNEVGGALMVGDVQTCKKVTYWFGRIDACIADSLQRQGISAEFRACRHRDFDLEVPAMDFHGEPAREATDELFEVKVPGSDRSDASVLGSRGANCDDVRTDRGLSCGNGRFVIDLEAPAEMYPVEEAGAICSSGLKSLQDTGADVNGPRVNSYSCSFLTTGLQEDSIGKPPEEKYSVDFHADSGPSGVSISGSFQSISPITQKCQSWTKYLHIDLNIPQDGPSADVCPEPLQKLPSLSSSSSLIINRDQWRKSNCKYPNNTEPSSKYQTQSNSVVPDLELNDSEKWMHTGLKDGCKFIRQSSELSSTVRETAWGHEKSAMDTEVDRSGMGSPVEFCRDSAEGISSTSNGATQNSTNGSAISFIELHKHTDEKAAPLLGNQHVSMHIVSRSETSNVTSSNETEEDCLHLSTQSANLIPSIDGLPGRKPTSHEKSEEDTVSSKAISSCEQQGDQNEKKIDRKRLCSNTGAPAPEISGICLDDRSFNICLSNPEEGEQLQTPVPEIDPMIFNAADTLVSMSLENPACPFNYNCEGEVEFENDEAKSQPQFTLDSFEEMTLTLEEIKDDGSSVSSKQLNIESGKESCGIKLRRGRGLRDFQKDILPGLVSLSRHEICEDIHTIKHELRKIRSHNAGEESFLTPLRTRRSRIYNAYRRS